MQHIRDSSDRAYHEKRPEADGDAHVLPTIWPSGDGALDALHDGVHVLSIVLASPIFTESSPRRYRPTRRVFGPPNFSGYDFPAHSHVELARSRQIRADQLHVR